MTHYSIAYINFVDAQASHCAVASMRNRAGRLVQANAKSIEMALMDVVDDISSNVFDDVTSSSHAVA